MSVLTSRNRSNAFSCAVPVVLNFSKYQDPLLPRKDFADLHAVVFQGLLAHKVRNKRKASVISERLEMDSKLVGDGGDDGTDAVVIVK